MVIIHLSTDQIQRYLSLVVRWDQGLGWFNRNPKLFINL